MNSPQGCRLGGAAIGHNLIPTPANTVPWNAVVESIYGGAEVETVVATTADLAAKQLRAAAQDPSYAKAVELLLKLPLAAREESFLAAARELGLELGAAPDRTEIVFAVADLLDRHAAVAGRPNDFSELVARALTGAFAERIGDGQPGLLDTGAADVVASLKRLSQPERFTGLARSFYSRLFSEVLSAFLDRVLATHVGPNERFDNAGSLSDFNVALSTYVGETTRIIHEFSAGWYGKHAFADAGLTDRKVSEFAFVALKKTLAELRRKEELGD